MALQEDKSKRDLVLAKVLDRLSIQIRQHDTILEEIQTTQNELVSAIKSIELHQDIRSGESDVSIDTLNQNLLRYRSDMLQIVNEQDRIGEFVKDVAKRQVSIDGAQERLVSNLTDLEKRYKKQEKTIHDHYEHSLELSESFSREVAAANQSVIKLHMDTEKRLSEMHSETHKQLEKVRVDAMARLLALDGIESALNTILVRTEPPEKKPFILLRPFFRLHKFFSTKLHRAIAKQRIKRNSDH